MPFSIEQIDAANLEEAEAYLRSYEDSAQFLLNNLSQYGSSLTDHLNSGNFKLLRSGAGVEGVFCLTRRGNLLAQAKPESADEILSAIQAEPVALKGFIGDWQTIEPIYAAFRKANPSYQPSFSSKEILYSLSLEENAGCLEHDPRVRFLAEEDYPQWAGFSAAYLAELNLPDDATEESRLASFRDQVARRLWWGLFEGGSLLSRTALNSAGEEVGQVGGVFTPVPHRRKGLSKATMLHMLKDCRDYHGHRKSILFTGETDTAAQRLYESIGYRRIGHFALILG